MGSLKLEMRENKSEGHERITRTRLFNIPLRQRTNKVRSLLQESKDREAKLQGDLSKFKRKNVKALDLEQVVESKSSEIDVLKSKVDLLESENASLSEYLNSQQSHGNTNKGVEVLERKDANGEKRLVDHLSEALQPMGVLKELIAPNDYRTRVLMKIASRFNRDAVMKENILDNGLGRVLPSWILVTPSWLVPSCLVIFDLSPFVIVFRLRLFVRDL
nr:hypothetical protein [Tanacetum cinerariifolium]